MYLISKLRKKFENVANPHKFFRKSYLVAAFAAFSGSYLTSGYLAWDGLQTEWNQENFKAHRLLPWNLAYNHGTKATSALAVSYIGDISLVYGLAGVAFWRRKKRVEAASISSLKQ